MNSNTRISLNQNNFTIDYILNRAGSIKNTNYHLSEYDKNIVDVENSDSECSYNCNSDTSEEFDNRILKTDFLNNCVPSFDWLYYTRYRPPKLPRPIKLGPTRRTPGRLPRVPFTSQQLQALEDAYKLSTYLSADDANKIAENLELTNTRVKIWFQNRRARERRERKSSMDNISRNMNE